VFDRLKKALGFTPVPVKLSSQLVQVGGRLLDVSGWPAHIVAKLRESYLMPSLKNAYLIRVDLSAGCPEGHVTTHRIGVFASTGDLTAKVAGELHKLRTTVQCRECGKPAKISGKHVAWQGDLGTWDGAQ